ncbi:MAG: hypothetical protein C0508_12085, partial [Cyanobacteria bacterium PR.023]|nr:hypothetical protein [Cyanobacteria bacterium PR.023]
FDLEALTKAFLTADGVVQVHDLHVWTITSGILAMSCHLTIEPKADSQAVLKQVNSLLEKDFKISHTTIQIELADSERKCNDICAVS